MKTKYLDNEIQLLYSIKRNNEISDYGQEKLNEFIAIKKQLTLTDVSQQSELLKFLGKHISEQYDIEESGLIEQLEWKAKNFNCCCVMCSLDFQEIENLVRLKHFEDSDHGNNKERCKELLEDSRNVVGYTLRDFENYT